MVEKAVRRRSWALEEIDIDGDDALTRDYGLRVPVVLGPGDVVLAEGRIEARSLLLALRKMET